MLSPSSVVVSVGNTRTQVAALDAFHPGPLASVRNDDFPHLVEAIGAAVREAGGGGTAPTVVLASVNDPVADRLASAVRDQLHAPVARFGPDLPVPVPTALDPETITGTDRLLAALAAWDVLRQACIVVDAGTAITVDFIDGEGTFHGGAILPGLAMQLRALHEHTAALPLLEPAPPRGEAFGRSTAQAMLHGVVHGARGAVHHLVEIYAEAYGAFPLVVATGGDAELLFAGDERVDRIVPDLALRGIGVALRHLLEAGQADDATR